MKSLFSLVLVSMILWSCQNEPKEADTINNINWKKRSSQLKASDSLVKGSSYLSVYSEIYSITEHRTINLTATVSLRNVSATDTIYMTRGNYYNTKGDLIRTYFDNPVYLKPLETLEIVIDENDTHGGSGANFIFEWAIKDSTHEPLFEAVMISTSGQQGISFITQGVTR